jgi:hypothetical protein
MYEWNGYRDEILGWKSNKFTSIISERSCNVVMSQQRVIKCRTEHVCTTNKKDISFVRCLFLNDSEKPTTINNHNIVPLEERTNDISGVSSLLCTCMAMASSSSVQSSQHRFAPTHLPRYPTTEPVVYVEETSDSIPNGGKSQFQTGCCSDSWSFC